MKPLPRIVVFGTESTGKTTLAERLAERFGEPWAPEFVREFWEQQNGVITADDLDAIARGQLANEEHAAARAKRVVLCDTDLITCTLWNDLLFPGACPAWVREEAERRARTYALYLFCDADVPFTPDAQRCFPEPAARERVRWLWREALVSRGLPFVEITGDWPEREQRAEAAVQAVLATAARRNEEGGTPAR
jgi:HTH-type transcriptional regulator, transcriptional repressor of NAD biosynthesis genes